MSVVPGDIDTSRQPPMAVPLRHFVVSLGLLLLGLSLALGIAFDIVPSTAILAHIHLLLAGWICVTIMGAMTQFVPVWSGVELHSRRLSTIQLWLVAGGLLGFASSFLTGRVAFLPVFGSAMLLGFWTFVYNIVRTLRKTSGYDVTERHFLLALGFFVLLTTLGFLLALDLVYPLFAPLSVTRVSVLSAHATLAVFGAVITTILGALYQLGTMFTQTELHGIDNWLRRAEEVGYPAGVVLLASGRLFGVTLVAQVGGLLVASTLLGFSILLGRRLYETSVQWNPMLSRYAVVAPALALWSLMALPVWFENPLSYAALFGAPSSYYLLIVGFIGFVVFGTLYHVVPFIVWVNRYSDLLGLEPVPMIDDLYSDRLARIDFLLLFSATALLAASDIFGLSMAITGVGSTLLFAGVVCFVGNVLQVIRAHSPHSLLGVLAPALSPDTPERVSESKTQ
ncbi:hypothetical protein [Haloferax sp. YSMS24]|uniref:hypothetical protein n=1 Tax=Haloferax sp. YSMS24 TaxID=3388425 RepID=UPI00398D0876